MEGVKYEHLHPTHLDKFHVTDNNWPKILSSTDSKSPDSATCKDVRHPRAQLKPNPSPLLKILMYEDEGTLNNYKTDSVAGRQR